jgi:hypothetical protein
LLSSAPSAALALPTDEPSDHEHGPHESDDHAYADEQIGENDSHAALDAHRSISRADGLPGSSITVFSYGGSPNWDWPSPPQFVVAGGFVP